MNSGVTNCSYYMEGEQGGEGICNVENQIFSSGTKKADQTFFFCIQYPTKKSTFPSCFMVSLRVTVICKRNPLV